LRLVFFVNVPIGLAAMSPSQRHVPAPAPRQRALDLPGQATGVVALAALTFALIEGGSAVGLLINLGFYGELFVINLSFQQVRHDSALVTGLALLPQMGVVAAASALSGRVTARVGTPRPSMLVGLLAGAAGLLGLVVAGSHSAVAVLGALVGKGASDAGGIRLALLIAAVVFLAGAALTAAWVRPERSAGRRRDVRVGVRDWRRR